MRQLAIILFLCCCMSASAADWITATIHVSTNAPLGNTNKVVINGDTRTFTNSVTGSPATLVQQTNSVTYTATNLLNHLTSYKVNPGYFLSQTSSTNVTVRGLVGGAMVVTIQGGWGHVTYSTQTVSSPTIVVRVPISSEAATNRVFIADGLFDAIKDYGTDSFDTNAVQLTNFITKGASPEQTIASPLDLRGPIRNQGSGTAVIATNLENHGRAFRSPGSGAVSTQIGSNSTATATRSVALGVSANASAADSIAIGVSPTASGQFSAAIGNSASATAQAATALGQGADASGVNSTAIGASANSSGRNASAVGNSATATETNAVAVGVGATASAYRSIAIGDDNTAASEIGAIAIGAEAVAQYQDSVAIGPSDSGTGEIVSTTKTNQIRLGTTRHTVSVPGLIDSPTSTNSTHAGTNLWNGDISFQRRANSSPVNGDNAGVVLGTNVVIAITGPTTIGSYVGFLAERGDSFHFIRFSGAVTNIIKNQSGVEPTAANRIITGTGGDLALTNEPSWIQVIRNGSSDRWEVIAHSR